jgi:uncharacterized surface protein with fasciclin (FAS1) repeats
MEKTTDIIETAIAAGKFSVLAKALTAANLVETLKGTGPFTVFAPTDEAFAKIPQETLNELLRPENKDKLTAILTYHVLSGKVMAADVANIKDAKTVQGQSIRVSSQDGVLINDAKVVATNIEASNGVIHVIDKVLLPPAAAAA